MDHLPKRELNSNLQDTENYYVHPLMIGKWCHNTTNKYSTPNAKNGEIANSRTN